MGWTRCAIRGCKSRPGERDPKKKKLFKGFPTKIEQQQLWRQYLPKDFVVTKCSTAICEDHFHKSQFERVRQDNRKKLKVDAVPFYFPTVAAAVRKPFGDITNTISSGQSPNTATWDHSYTRPLVAQAKPLPCGPTTVPVNTPALKENAAEAAQALLMLCGSADVSPKSESVSIEVACDPVVLSDESSVDVLDMSFEPALNSTAIINESLARELSIVAEWSDEVFILDDVTGEFRLSESHECDDLDQCYINLRTNALENLSDLCDKQSCTIVELRRRDEEKEATIEKLTAELEFQGYFNVDFKKKYDMLTKRISRMKAQIHRENFSPWLSQSQLQRIYRTSNRGIKWDMEDIRSGLVFKMKCGSSGYNAFVKQFPILPAKCVLQQCVQFVRFDSGLLLEIFDLLEGMLKNASESWKDCQLVLDEMTIEQSERYCNSLKKWVGKATLPTHDGIATKALVFILAGITKRWKLAVAVYFTNKRTLEVRQQKGDNLTGIAYANIIDSILIKAKSVGANVVNVTSDMGADNLALWKKKGVTGGRKKTVISSFPHPSCPDKKIFVLPDSVHLMKSIKTMLENNQTVILDQDLAREEGLPTNIVDYKHVEDLYEFESEGELKVAFRLRPENIYVDKQFSRMRAGVTKAVMCHATGAGLNGMAEVTGNTSYKTTAWFFIFLNVFFDLVTARHAGMAISRFNENVFHKSLDVIRKMDRLFHTMKVGSEYKPAQRGVRVLCQSLLGLIDYLIVERNYKFLMLGRFTSDCLENLFSCIRLAQKVPHAVAFLQNLKVITLAQFSEAVKGSSYAFEESCALPGDFLEEARKRATNRVMSKFEQSFEELCKFAIRRLEQKDYDLILNWWQKAIVYDMAGSVIAAIERGTLTRCEHCIAATKWNGESLHEMALITDMKEFTILRADDEAEGQHKPALLNYVSDPVYRAILTAEISFRLYREKTIHFQNTDVLQYFVNNLMYVWDGAGIPNCHGLGRKILTIYFDARLKEFGKRRTELIQVDRQSKRGSKSAAGHLLTDEIPVSCLYGANQKSVQNNVIIEEDADEFDHL